MARRTARTIASPEPHRLRLVQQVAAGTPGAVQDSILGQWWTTKASRGLNGTSGFNSVELTRTLNDAAEQSLSLPPAGSDGVSTADRLYVLADSVDPRTSSSRTPYMPGDEWIEVYRGRADLQASGTPVSETTAPDQVTVSTRDVMQLFRKTREMSSGFWTHSPRDVFEHYTRVWQAGVVDDFVSTDNWSGASASQSPGTSVDGVWGYLGSASCSKGLLTLSIPQGQSSAHLRHAAATAPASDGGVADHSCWRAECLISTATFSGTPRIVFGVGPLSGQALGLTTAFAGAGSYSLSISPVAGSVNVLSPHFLTWASWPVNAGGLLDSANQLAPPYTIAIEARERWVYFYLDGQLVSVVPRGVFDPYNGYSDVRPYVWISGSPGDSVGIDYVVQRATTAPLNGGDPGDYVLPSAPSSGGLQGQYFDTSLLSQSANAVGQTQGQFGVAPLTVSPGTTRVDTGLVYSLAGSLLPPPSGLAGTQSTRGSSSLSSSAYYVVTALNSNGETTASNEAMVVAPTPLATPAQSPFCQADTNSDSRESFDYCVAANVSGGGETLPSRPSGADDNSASVGPGSHVTVSWNAVAGAAYYSVYRRSTNPAGATNYDFVLVGITAALSLVDTWSTRPSGKAVQSVNTTNRFASALTWSAIPGAARYNIYRGSSSGSELYLDSVSARNYVDQGTITPGSTTPPASNTAVVVGTPAPGFFPSAIGNARQAYVRWTGSIYLNLGGGSPVVLKLPAGNLSQAMWVGRTRQGESVLHSPSPIAAYAPGVLQDQPGAYFRLDEVGGSSMIDQTGAITDAIYLATYMGQQNNSRGPAPVGSQYGPMTTRGAIQADADTALAFAPDANGNAPYARASTQAELAYSSGTLEAWVYLAPNKDTSQGMTIVTKANAYGLFVKDGKLQAYDYGASAWRSSGYSLPTGTWTHVALTFQLGVAGGTQLYANGSPVGSPVTCSIVDQTGVLQVALGGPTPSPAPWNGALDEIAVYPYVLSPQQIATHYAKATQMLEDFPAETPRSTSPDLRASLGTTSGWYPMVFEYVFRRGDPGSTVVGFTDASGAAISPAALSPYGVFADQIPEDDSHFDTLQTTIAQSFAYQFLPVPKSLESGFFPGAVSPRVRVGRDTDFQLDDSAVDSPSETSSAEDNATTNRAQAQGLGGNSSGSLTAEAFNFAAMRSHPVTLTESESLPGTSESDLLALQLETLLGLRSASWQSITADSNQPREKRDSWPLTGVLSDFDWTPGDGLRVVIPQIGVMDTSPRQIQSLKRTVYQDGVGANAASFKQYPRDFQTIMRRFVRQFYSSRRAFQGQLTYTPGSHATAPAYSVAPLPADLTQVRQATLTVLSKSDSTTPFGVIVNGVATGQIVYGSGVVDVSNYIGRNNAVEPQMVVQLTTSSLTPCSVSYTLSLLVLIDSI